MNKEPGNYFENKIVQLDLNLNQGSLQSQEQAFRFSLFVSKFKRAIQILFGLLITANLNTR